MLQIVVAAMIAGAAIDSLGERRGEPLVRLLHVVQGIALKIADRAMPSAPLALFGPIGDVASRTGICALIGMTAHIAMVVAGWRSCSG